MKHPGFGGDVHHHHHAGEQPERVEIHRTQRLLLIKQAAINHQHRAEQGDDGAVQLFQNQDDINDDEDEAGEPHRVQTKNSVFVHGIILWRPEYGRECR